MSEVIRIVIYLVVLLFVVGWFFKIAYQYEKIVLYTPGSSRESGDRGLCLLSRLFRRSERWMSVF